jgi:HAD superfamily hydrolase (TIGR01509 family)
LVFSAAIFDLDGTLIESNSLWERINKHMLQKRGIKYNESLIRKMVVMSFEESADAMRSLGATETVDELAADMLGTAAYEYRNNIFLKDNVREYLGFLQTKKVKIALATASPRTLFEPVLRNNHIFSCFDAFCTTEDAGRGKDFPDVYITAAAKLGVSPSDCVVFEDVIKGVVSAKNAGMKTVAVYDRYSGEDIVAMRLIADKFIYDFSEMF